MANSFLPYYAGSMAPPIRGPNGGLVPVPNYLTPEEIYRDILPPPSLPLNPPMPPRPNNSWPGGTSPVGPGPGSYAQMLGFAGDPSYGGGSVQTAAIPQVPGPNGSLIFDKDPARLMSGSGLAFAGDQGAPPGVAAIDQAAGMPPMPIPRPSPPMPPEMPVAGDPWAGMRINSAPYVPREGMATGGVRASPPVPPRPYGSTFNDVPRRPSPESHKRLMAQQSSDQRGRAALRASGMLDEFGMIT